MTDRGEAKNKPVGLKGSPVWCARSEACPVEDEIINNHTSALYRKRNWTIKIQLLFTFHPTFPGRKLKTAFFFEPTKQKDFCVGRESLKLESVL